MLKNASKAIEPSEILVDGKGTVREESFRADPWLRFLARFFDYALFFLLLGLIRSFTQGHFALKEYEYWVPLEYFVWIPVEALLLNTWGTTPGKALLGIRIRQGRRKRLEYLTALRRGFHVWVRGLGMGLPILNIFCLLVAYQRLKTFQRTSWDRDDHITVSYSPVGRKSIFFAIAIIALSFFLYFILK